MTTPIRLRSGLSARVEETEEMAEKTAEQPSSIPLRVGLMFLS
jgi:hypothetical protein